MIAYICVVSAAAVTVAVAFAVAVAVAVLDWGFLYGDT